ncbi:MAG: mechanosensitive ion channel family protein [Thermoflexales bacterium]
MAIDKLLQLALDPSMLPGGLVYFVAVAVTAWLLSRLWRHLIRRLLEREQQLLNRTTLEFTAQIGSVLIYVLAFVVYASLVPALRALGTALLASVGIVSLVIGLAAQNTLSNLVAGLTLAIYRPFEIHDHVRVLALGSIETGVVESLTLGYTILRTLDNRRIVIPNSVMSSQILVNLTMRDARKMVAIPLTTSFTADIDRVRALALEVACGHPNARQVVGCPVTQLSRDGITLSLQIWCDDFLQAEQLRIEITEQLKKRFDAEGIELKAA